jgi:hypothetical protein
MPNITPERLEELELAARTLAALEALGVDNWDGYDDAMAPIRAEAEHKEFLEDIWSEIQDRISAEIEEPAGRGCGYGVTAAGATAVIKYLGTLNIPIPKR